MNALVIARKEFDDALRSRLLWALIGFVGLFVAGTMGVPLVVPMLGGDPLQGLGAASEFAAILVPIVSLVAAYLALAGERESGSLRILLGLEPDRQTVVLGKFLGRGAVVALGVGAGFLLAGVVGWVLYGGLPAVAFLAVTALTAALGVAFVGIAVGISAATATRSRAMTVGIAAYLGLTLLWDLLPQGLHLAVEGAPPGASVPGWFVFLQGFSPSGAYSALVMAAIHATNADYPGIATNVSAPVPVYVQPWVFAALLLTWTVVPLLVGGVLFARADLN
jgi:ABC-type transport system involved in multi-copper enzyme maturation permease subunit